ncbi:MAG: hypothetical protein ACOX81_06610 [Candidatus Heteroscillospira sp.]
MTSTYGKFLKKNIDLSRLGLETGSGCAYFCTPRGAKVIGRTGVDGIHYCFVRGFGDMVFAVSPMSTPGDYVHPVAHSFADFLRLLLSCGGEAALEQAYAWEQEQFDAFLLDNPITSEQKMTLDDIRDKMGLQPMDKPFAYIKKLQSEFDYSGIKYTGDYFDPDMNPNAAPEPPEWKVYFEGSFWGRRGRGRAGTEIAVNREFSWGGRRWMVPSVYSCGKGLVVDFCLRVPREHILAFMDKWQLSGENDGSDSFTREQRMLIDVENPLCADFHPEAVVNGRALRTDHGCGACWNPCLPEEYLPDTETRSVMEHYGLDRSCGWAISRWCFLWASGRRPDIKSLSLTLSQDRAALPGPHFRASAPGDACTFVRPATGQSHTLTVQEYEYQELPENSFGEDNMEYPRHYAAMSYTVEPPLPGDVLTVQDCFEGDRPRPKKLSAPEPEGTSAACIGIIGGADGPTAIIFGASADRLRAACSSLRFTPAESIEWRIVFNEKQLDDISLELIGGNT